MIFRARHTRSLLRGALACLLAMALAPACALFGGGGEGSWTRSEKYSATAPTTWKARDKDNSDRAYQLASGSIATVTSSCTKNPETPLPLLTKHLLMGTRKVVYEKQEPITVDGVEGLLSKVRATMDGTAFQMLLVVAVKSGCVFDFSLVSPRALSDRDESEFLAFVRSFKHGTN